MKTRIVALLSLMAIMAATGCAVLRVDVDVYKGPMANNDRVQLEQLAVMAVGAKPLLVQLRDNLENPAHPESLHDKPWYKAGYVGVIPGQPHRFREPNAERVDAILSLYDDVSPDRLRVLFEEGARTVQCYKTAWGAFTEVADGPRSWEHLKVAISDFIGDPGCACWDFAHPLMKDSTCKEDYSKYIRELYESYRDCLKPKNPAWRWNYGQDTEDASCCSKESCAPPRDCIVHIHEFLFENSKGNALIADLPVQDVFGKDLTARVLKPSIEEKDHGNLLRKGANSLYYALSRPEVVRAHAELLFSDKRPEARERFVEEVNRVAKAFLEARGALHDLTQLLLEGLALSYPPDVLDEVRKDARNAAIDMACKLVSAEKLMTGLDVLDATRSATLYKTPVSWNSFPGGPHLGVTNELKNLESPLKEFSTPLIAAGDAELSGDPPPASPARRQEEKDYTRQLKSFLDAHTQEAATLFLCADDALLQLDKHTDPEISARYRFGLTHGPFGPSEDVLTPGPLADLFQQVAKGYAFGLEKGRLPQGLDSMIEAQLKAHELGAPGSPSRLGPEDKQLLSALVQFAAKVLMIANNELLLEYGRPHTLPTGVNSSQESSGAAPCIGYNKMVRQSTAVLQSIGNSIITEADDLRNREEHKRRLIHKKDEEVEAVVSTSGAGQDVLRDVANGATDARDALNRLDAALFEMRLRATKEGNDEEVKRLEECIEQVKARRVNLAYLRPASAYLRNSYATTLVQGKPSTTWENMLDKQMWRSSAVGEFFMWLANCEKTKQTEEIDKQFWQNINSVRVAGTGNTNYVVTKDDIGNWSVRNFSADPGTVFQGAKDLLTYSVGVARAEEAAKKAAAAAKSKKKSKTNNDKEDKSKPAAAPATGAGFGPNEAVPKMLARAEKDYWDATKKDLDRLNSLLQKDGIDKDINAAWDEKKLTPKPDKELCEAKKTYLCPIKKTIGEATAKVNDADDKIKKKPDNSELVHESLKSLDPGAQVLVALREIHRFHNDLFRALSEQGARDALSNAVWPILKEFLESRIKAAGDFQSALQLMNAGAN